MPAVPAAASVPPWPATVASLADVAAIEALATRSETPCGEGRMVWHAWGPAGGEPVVLLHGGAGSWTHWVRNLAALVAAGRRVWVPDLPGFGDSDRPPQGQDADVLPPWVELGLQAALGDAPCDLVAFSFGSMVATFLAAAHPARVTRLVLVGAPALMNDPGRDLKLRAWAHLPPGAERDAAMRHNLLSLMLAREDSLDDLSMGLQAGNVVRDRMKLRRISKTDVLLRTLPAVRCAVFGIWGERDMLYRGRTDLLEPALRQAPGFRSLTLVPRAGHWVQFEEAAAFDAALREALAASADPP